MKLSELLQFDNIVIQAHNNPDADALASGFGLYLYFQRQGKQVRLIYGGPLPVRKSNLRLMLSMLSIPAEHVTELPEEPGLLLTVDCQPAERNVQTFAAKHLAAIDHHMVTRPEKLPTLSEIHDNYGSCATLVYEMLAAEGFPAERNERLATALYYGLYMDTNRLQELRHPKDKDMRDALEFRSSKTMLFQFQNCNLSLDELKIAGKALADYDYHEDYRYALVRAERCDPNILGIISDMLIEVDRVDACIAYCHLSDGVKLSVRSSVRETRADELAAFVTRGIGSGGGHQRKAGGFIDAGRLLEACAAGIPDGEAAGQETRAEEDANADELRIAAAARELLLGRMNAYFETQDYIYAGTEDVPDLTKEGLFRKKRLPIGYVKATDMYPVGTRVEVRMLEGDLPFTVKEDTYFIIGVESEVYKNDEAYFLSHNDPTEEPYVFQGEYAPTVHHAVNLTGLAGDEASVKSLKDYARTCIPKESSLIRARKLDRRTKVFVSWSDNYMLGNPGDWLAARSENPRDVYIVRGSIFDMTYERVEDGGSL